MGERRLAVVYHPGMVEYMGNCMGMEDVDGLFFGGGINRNVSVIDWDSVWVLCMEIFVVIVVSRSSRRLEGVLSKWCNLAWV